MSIGIASIYRNAIRMKRNQCSDGLFVSMANIVAPHAREVAGHDHA